MKASDKSELKDRDSDEIDLIEVLLQLWRAKWVITLFIVLGLLVSGAFLYSAPQKWTSTAIISRPDSAQIASYSHAVNVLEGSGTKDSRDIESRVINRFAMAFAALADTLRNQRHQETLTIEPTIKGQTSPLKMTYQAESADMAQAGLTKYIQQTNSKIAHDLENDLQESLQQKTEALNSLLATQEKIALEQKNLRIEQIKEALKFAEAANITHPQERQGDNVTQDTLFLLGSEALNAMVERESMRPLAYPQGYFETRQHLLEIEDLNTDKININVFRYVLKPNLPIHRDGPKTALFLVLGVLLGTFMGCGVILGRNALRDYKKRH